MRNILYLYRGTIVGERLKTNGVDWSSKDENRNGLKVIASRGEAIARLELLSAEADG